MGRNRFEKTAIRSGLLRLSASLAPILFTVLVGSISREATAEEPASQPFSVAVATRPLEMLRGNLDYPVAQIVVNGELWLIFVPGSKAYGRVCPVYRYKGPDFEHLTRQPDGTITPPPTAPGDLRSYHMGCGLWYDPGTKRLYALAHSEYDHKIWTNFNGKKPWSNGAGWCRKKTSLATSSDMGLTWTVVGDVLTASLPNLDDWSQFSGSEFEAGPADFSFYADTRGGYFYVTSCNAFVPKNGLINGFHMFAEVARCVIYDRMAPGKWRKFNNGAWTEPGLGGKASRVGMDKFGLYGNTMYSTYLRKYFRVGIAIGCTDDRGMPPQGLHDHSIYISTCSDLAKQDWTPMAKLLDEPNNTLFGFSLAGVGGVDPVVCDRTLRVYNYWLHGSRTLDVTLGEGTTRAVPFPPYGSYSYEPHPESGDRVESRRTRIVGCASPDMRYAGDGWTAEKGASYYQGEARSCGTTGGSVVFSFQGSEIYWRAVASQDGGKADVYLDDQPPATVDCYFWDSSLPYLFAFIKTGLDPRVTHTIKIVVRGDRNPDSSGTRIRHMAFEYAAESYKASAGFCSVAGKNNWRYRLRNGSDWRDLAFVGLRDKIMWNYWSDGGHCTIGNNYQITDGSADAVREWAAPHDGNVRIEGTVESATGGGVHAEILKNADVAWPSRLVPQGKGESHDLTIFVKKGDSIRFVVKPSGEKSAGKAVWDPVITYISG